MRISLIQTDIVWQHRAENVASYEAEIRKLKGNSDLAVLPELCPTGFGVEAPSFAETVDGPSMTALRKAAVENHIAVTGSFAAREGDPIRYYNRGFFIFPDGGTVYSDKRHLFRIGVESKYFLPGENTQIIPYLGWNIRLIICFDLRFPVWCRNVRLGYDLLVCVANWPASRIQSWDNMLETRATENQAYACGVNRVGTDSLELEYPGHSNVYDPIGTRLTSFKEGEIGVRTVTLDKEQLARNRKKFPAWKEADSFRILS